MDYNKRFVIGESLKSLLLSQEWFLYKENILINKNIFTISYKKYKYTISLNNGDIIIIKIHSDGENHNDIIIIENENETSFMNILSY